MATLTTDEIEYIRDMSGDDCEDYDVTDEKMQKIYDRASAITCTCENPLDVTVVLVLQIRVAKATKLFDDTDAETGGARSVSQKYKHLKELLDRWETKCGMAGGSLSVGTLNLGLSAREGSDYSGWPNVPAWWGIWP